MHMKKDCLELLRLVIVKIVVCIHLIVEERQEI